MDIIRKYWWCFLLALIVIPILINFVLLIPAFTPIVGDNTTWLSFFGSLIGALASFFMIFFTAKTLEQNKEQLFELKRQWEEEHRPHVGIRIIVYNHAYFFEYFNSGKEDAYGIKISINDSFYSLLDNQGREYFKNALSYPEYIPSGKSIYHFIGWCKDINSRLNEDNRYIFINGHFNNIYEFNFKLDGNQFFDKKHMIVRSPIEKALEDIAEGLVRPNCISKPKAIQLYMRSISDSLEVISKYLKNDNNDTEQNK